MDVVGHQVDIRLASRERSEDCLVGGKALEDPLAEQGVASLEVVGGRAGRQSGGVEPDPEWVAANLPAASLPTANLPAAT